MVPPTLYSYDTSGSTVSNASTATITSYAGPGPAAGSGPHRCVVICIQNRWIQPDKRLLFAVEDGVTDPRMLNVDIPWIGVVDEAFTLLDKDLSRKCFVTTERLFNDFRGSVWGQLCSKCFPFQ